MKSRPLFIAFVLGALLMMSIPAIADHVSEPTLPIAAVRSLDIYDYPNLVTRIGNCDGSETRTWDSARVELRISFEMPNGRSDNANPSEHFQVREVVSRVTEKANGDLSFRKDWDAMWSHQNRGPHTETAQRWEVVQSNTYFLQEHPGLWHIRFQVTGDISGRVLTAECLFRVVAP